MQQGSRQESLLFDAIDYMDIYIYIYIYIYMKTLLCVISPICCKLSCYDDVGFFAKEKCEKSKKLNVK